MKARRRQAREAWTSYRVRRKKVRAKPATRKGEVPRVPWGQRIAPTDEQLRDWDAWLNEHEPEFEEKYPGQFIAIWDKQVIVVAANRRKLYRLSHQTRPEVIPLVSYVPREQDINIAPSNFPAEWIKK
jgi:uncharacterized protein DUF5678